MKSKGRNFLYIRWSTSAQDHGSSEERQLGFAERWCKEHGETLDGIYADRGISARLGKNREKGQLGDLLREVKANDRILIEDEDRFSREDPLKALTLLQETTNKNVEIVRTVDGRVTTKENFFSIANFLPTILKQTLGYEESAKKVQRLNQAWVERREIIMSKKNIGKKGKAVTGRLPFWLKIENGKTVKVNEAAAVVKHIFELSLAGRGIRSIVEDLNQNKFSTFSKHSKVWQGSKVQWVLKTPTVYGAFQSYRKVIKDGKIVKEEEGDLVEGLFPEVITKETFMAVQHKISKRQRFTGGRYDATKVNNLFTGLCKCEHCLADDKLSKSGSMVYSRKDGKGYLTCNNFHYSGLCKAGVINYRAVENSILTFITVYSHVLPPTVKQSNVELEAKQGELKDLEGKINALAGKIADDENSPRSLIARLTEMESRYDVLTKEIETFKGNDSDADQSSTEFDVLRAELEKKQVEDRLWLRDKIRSTIKGMVMNVQENRFEVEFYHHLSKVKFELKKTFRGCKPAIWHFRFLIRGMAGWSSWLDLGEGSK